MKHNDLYRMQRVVAVAHGEAFQLMLYKADGKPDLWIWNSRDGVSPFGVAGDYRHAMNAYRPTYSAILPDEASHVFADYDRQSWEAMQRERYEDFANSDGPYGGPAFLDQFPTPQDWLNIAPFEAGQPRMMTRDEWLDWTPSYVARSHHTSEIARLGGDGV